MTLYDEKVKELSKSGRKAGVDAFLVSSATNMKYLAGFSTLAIERFAALVISVDRESPSVIIPKLEMQKVKASSAFKEIRGYDDSENPGKLLKQTLTELDLEKATIGVEWSFPFRFYKMLNDYLPRVKIVDASRFFSQLRTVKSDEELKRMKKAADIVATGIDAGIRFVKPGVSELSVSFEIEKTIKQNGGESVPFCIVLSGANSAFPHGETSSRKIGREDVLLMDVGAVFKGYYADLTRTVFVGKATKLQRKIYDVVAEAQHEAIEAVKPGTPAERVDVAARKTIERAGYGECFTHRTGHGLGLEVHEEPYISEGNKTILKRGMTFTVEPGVYLSDKFGVRIEDDVVVSAKKADLLSNLSKELLIV